MCYSSVKKKFKKRIFSNETQRNYVSISSVVITESRIVMFAVLLVFVCLIDYIKNKLKLLY